MGSFDKNHVTVKMWSVTGVENFFKHYHSFILISVIIGVSVSDQFLEQDRHGYGRHVTRVSYQDHHHDNYAPSSRRVIVRKKILRPRQRHRTVDVVHHVDRPLATVPVDTLHPVAGYEGSYVAVSGQPGRGSVHVVENVQALGHDSVTVVNGVSVRSRHGSRTAVVPVSPVAPPPVVHPAIVAPTTHAVVAPAQTPVVLQASPAVAPQPGPRQVINGDRLPLPKCSYINTDFPGDDLILEGDEEPGINAGSARACKARCRLEDACSFWTYKEGFSRDTFRKDCYLKEGTPGLPVPREAVPRLGFVSGTQDNNCVCIKSEDEEDEVCPIKEPRGLVYPWRSLDEEENDLEQGLPPLGWNRGVYGGLDPRLGPVLGGGLGSGDGDNLLLGTVRDLQDQLNAIARRLGGRTSVGDSRDL